MARDPQKWLKAPKSQGDPEVVDEGLRKLEDYIATYERPKGVPAYIALRDRDVWRDDPAWPGDTIAAKLDNLYRKYVRRGKTERYYTLADLWMNEARRQRKATGRIRRRLPS